MSVLTVITISKNNPLGFKKTLDSLLNAGLIVSSVKLLVINGGSELLLKSELDDLDVLNSDNIEILTGLDFGIFNAMNLGLSKVPTQYVLFLNSGDEICRGFNFNHIIPEIIRLGSNWIIADAFFIRFRSLDGKSAARSHHCQTVKSFCRRDSWASQWGLDSKIFDESSRMGNCTKLGPPKRTGH